MHLALSASHMLKTAARLILDKFMKNFIMHENLANTKAGRAKDQR